MEVGVSGYRVYGGGDTPRSTESVPRWVYLGKSCGGGGI